MSVFALGIMTMAASERSGAIGEITKKDAEGRFSDIQSPTAASPSLSHYNNTDLGWEWILVSALHVTQINSSSTEHHDFSRLSSVQPPTRVCIFVVVAVHLNVIATILSRHS